MRQLGSLIIGLLVLPGSVYASPNNFDIFGVEEPIQQKIYSCCSEIIEQYINEYKKLYSSEQLSEKELLYRFKLEKKLMGQIKQIGNFAEVKISAIHYPMDKKMFSTMDIVKANEVYRIPNKKRVTNQSKIASNSEITNLFKVWKDYDEQKVQLMRENKLAFSTAPCPVLHCIWGFDKEDMKNVLPKLQAGATQHKQALMNIIENSADDNERGDAIFILAHDNHYQEIANFLINFTDDPSDLVRNNVMRVLGAIVEKHKVENLPLKKITQALNYPYVTDRNKAAYVLLGIIKSDPKTHAEVINQSGSTLIELLKLKQPNNHEYAYQILKLLSHKNYSENDYENWSKWIKEYQS